MAGTAVTGRTRRCHAGKTHSAQGIPGPHHGLVSGSVLTDPRRLRAARRAAFPAVRMRPPAPGRHHPATVADVRAALTAFGEVAYYGLNLVELIPTTRIRNGPLLGSLAGPGHVVLYDQPRPPWRLGAALSGADRAWLASAGAEVSTPAVVAWPGDSLRRFMLGHVLAHEIGHHLLQHERRLRGERAARQRDHEARAEVVAAALRERLTWC
jgi:hypothetical protein